MWKEELIVNKFIATTIKEWIDVLPLCLKQSFLPIIWIFIEGEEIESRLPFKIFSTLYMVALKFEVECLQSAAYLVKTVRKTVSVRNKIKGFKL